MLALTTSELELSAGIAIAGVVMVANPANSLQLLFSSSTEPSAVVYAEQNLTVHVNPCSKPLGDLATKTALKDGRDSKAMASSSSVTL